MGASASMPPTPLVAIHQPCRRNARISSLRMSRGAIDAPYDEFTSSRGLRRFPIGACLGVGDACFLSTSFGTGRTAPSLKESSCREVDGS